MPGRLICLAALILTGAGALYLSHDWLRAPYITNDGYQYLDAAASVRAGTCLCTNMAYFDGQIAAGRLPVPLTHYPPGYPLLIAGLSELGMSPVTAGYFLSIAGYLLSIWFIWDVALLLGSRSDVAFLITLGWISSKAALTYAGSVLTEMLFTAIFMAVIALVVRDLRTDGRRPALLAAIGLLAGAGYFIRYAGLFLLPPAVLYLTLRAWRRGRAMPWALAGILAICAFTVPVWIRNISIVGAWQGPLLSNAPLRILSAIPLIGPAGYHLVFGEVTPVPYAVWWVLLCTATGGGLILAIQSCRKAQARGREFLASAPAWMAVFEVAYIAGIILAKAKMSNMNSEVADVIRYLVPAYPVALAFLAAVLSRIRFEGMRLASGFVVVSVMLIQAMNFILRPALPEHLAMTEILQKELPSGEAVGHWLRKNAAPGTVIVAEEGMALHYVTQHPVVSIVEPPENSNRPVDGPGIRALMSRYHSRYLVAFPVLRSFRGSAPFLRDLGRGSIPGWLVRLPGTADVSIYRCDVCVR